MIPENNFRSPTPEKVTAQIYPLEKYTVKWGDIEQLSMFFLNKLDELNYMTSILQT